MAKLQVPLLRHWKKELWEPKSKLWQIPDMNSVNGVTAAPRRHVPIWLKKTLRIRHTLKKLR